MEYINRKIKELRKEHNMTLKEVAYYLGVTEATVQRYESNKGINAIPYDRIIGYSKLFGVSPSALMGYKEVPKYVDGTVELIDLFSKVTIEQRDAVLNLLRSFVNSANNN